MQSQDDLNRPASSDLANPPRILELLERGEINLSGQFVWGSNYTFLVQVGADGHVIDAVYKPAQGERPLWDFPRHSLAKREVAAYLTNRGLGWNLVPPTVLRKDGPAGAGSLQLYIPSDPNHHYFTFSDAERELLRATVLFDILINNADRKGGHILLEPDGQVWLIDHGVSFHVSDKLRTVVWDFVGETIPKHLLEDVEGLCQQLQPGEDLFAQLGYFLSRAEIEALRARSQKLLGKRVFPEPGPGRPFPWPQI